MASSGFRHSPPPLYAVRWERTLPFRGYPLLLLLDQGFPLLPLVHTVRWERTLPFGGVFPFLRARSACCGRARPVPHPLLPARGLRALLGLGVPICVLGLVTREVPRCCVQGPPSAPAEHRGKALLGGGSPFPFLSSANTRVKRTRLFRGGTCLAPRRYPLSPLLLTWSSWPRRPCPSSSVINSLAVILRPFSVSPPSLPQSPLFWTLSPVPPLPSSRGPLLTLVPPLAPLSTSLADNIARRDGDVGDWTGRVIAHGSMAGGSAPPVKSLSWPRVVVRDGISRPLLLHLHQH